MSKHLYDAQNGWEKRLVPLQMREDEPDVWLVDCSITSKLPDVPFILSPAEINRYQSYSQQTDRNNFAFRRTALRMLLGRILDQNPIEITLQELEGKKPCLPSRPKLDFSTSHSHTKAIIAVNQSAVGIDIERIDTKFPFANLWPMVGNTPEDAPAREDPVTFFKYWSAKEAILKTVGKGLSIPMTDIDISISKSQFSIINLPGNFPPPPLWRTRFLPSPEGFTTALAWVVEEN